MNFGISHTGWFEEICQDGRKGARFKGKGLILNGCFVLDANPEPGRVGALSYKAGGGVGIGYNASGDKSSEL